MLSNNIYYHQITRKIIVAFGALFSNIKIIRSNEGIEVQGMEVPIAYAPKEKWIMRIDQDPNLDSYVYTSLPRLSFEMTGLTYDSTRKVNRMGYISCGDGTDTVQKMYSPVPYNFEISLYVISKTQEDALQIVEQILPTFSPEYTLSLQPISDNDLVVDVPVILNSVSLQDDYEGDFQTRRFITYTLNFTLKAYMYGPIKDGKVITTTIVDMTNPDTEAAIGNYSATGDPSTGDVTSDLWNNF